MPDNLEDIFSVPPPESELDPKVAKEESKIFTERMEELTKIIQNYDFPPDVTSIRIASSDNSIAGYLNSGYIEYDSSSGKPTIAGKNNIGITVDKTPLGGLGWGDISFRHNETFRVDPKNYPEDFPADSPNQLDISLHLDDTTSSRVHQLLIDNPEGINHINTVYYFDKNGRFGKKVRLPKEVTDPRPSIPGEEYEGERYVIGKMTPADFELAGIAVDFLERTIKDSHPYNEAS